MESPKGAGPIAPWVSGGSKVEKFSSVPEKFAPMNCADATDALRSGSDTPKPRPSAAADDLGAAKPRKCFDGINGLSRVLKTPKSARQCTAPGGADSTDIRNGPGGGDYRRRTRVRSAKAASPHPTRPPGSGM